MNQKEATKRFYEWMWPLRADVLRTSQILTGNLTEAEDLAQETLLKAFRFIDRFSPATDAKAWLMTILRNTRIDRLRAAKAAATISLDDLTVEPAQEEAELPAISWEQPQEVLNGFSDQQMIDALQAMPEEIRWTLLLVDVEGLEQTEVARILEVPVGTIKSRAHRGRAMLRKVLLPMARDRRLVDEVPR